MFYGWVKARHQHKRVVFLGVTDPTGTVQCVVEVSNKPAFELARHMSQETAVKITGAVVIDGSQFLFMLSSLFSGGTYPATSPNQLSAIQFQDNGTGPSPASSFASLSRAGHDTYSPKPIVGIDSERDYNGPHICWTSSDSI